MTTTWKDGPVRANAFCWSSDRRASSAAMFPADKPCFDIFSPPPGERDVINQVEQLSSNEAKIAPGLVWVAVGSAKWGPSDISRLQAERICDLSLRTSASRYPLSMGSSTSSAISHPAARSASSEKKLSGRGELRQPHELELGRADFPRAIQVHVTEPFQAIPSTRPRRSSGSRKAWLS